MLKPYIKHNAAQTVRQILLTCLASVPMLANAANVSWRPTVQLGGGYDNNVRMAYDIPGQDIEESTLYQGQVDSELAVSSEALTSTLYGRYWYQSISANSDYNADVKQLHWGFSNAAERSLTKLDLNAQYDTTLTSEFDSSGLSLREKKDRHYYSGKFTYRWNLTPRSYVSGDLGADAVRYIDAENVGLNDYDVKSSTLSYGFNLSERINVGVQAVYSEFKIPSSHVDSYLSRESETENLIVVLFGDYAVSERNSLNFQVGYRTSNFYEDYFFERTGASDTVKETGDGQVFTLGYTRKFDASSLQISASRDLRPNGSGAVIEQDSLSLEAQCSLSEQLMLTSTLSVNQQREPATRRLPGSNTTEDINYDHDFSQFQVALRYSVSEQHVVALELDTSQQTLDQGDTIKAKGTAVYLRWYWNPPQKSL